MHFVIVCVVLTIVTTSATAADKLHFAHALKKALEDIIIQDHEAFLDSALEMIEPIHNLCDDPSKKNLEVVHKNFEVLVLNWSRIEMYRFGPALENNLFEKLFYWPDRRGRAINQVRKVLFRQDQTVLTTETLAQKSVAVQGLLALEFILFGTGSETLVIGNTYRCNYLGSIAGVIAMNASSLLGGWQGEAGYATEMLNAGQANSLYNSSGEAIQELIKAAATQLQIVGELKIAASIGKLAKKAKPKRAPFWRSDLTTATMLVNIITVKRLLDSGISELVVRKDVNADKSIKFQLNQVSLALETINNHWIDAVSSEQELKVLFRSHHLLTKTVKILQTSYPRALGLIFGFNTLDGD